jgi:hypothetical protein
MNRRNRR